ncbi:MAG: hypothetical protein NC336_02535 [Clostridium sp.]|nr:hypothetical protein [Clostridium sp.]
MIFPWMKKTQEEPAEVTFSTMTDPAAELTDALGRLGYTVVDTHYFPSPDESGDAKPASGGEKRVVSDIAFSCDKGKFIVFFFENKKFARIMMPGIHKAGQRDFNEVRFVCNMMSSQRFVATPFFILDQDEDGFVVSLSAMMTLMPAGDLVKALPPMIDEFVVSQSVFAKRFSDLLERRGENAPFDFENEMMVGIQKTNIVRRLEMLNVIKRGVHTPGPDVTLGSLLENMTGIDPARVETATFILPAAAPRNVCSGIGSLPLLADMFDPENPTDQLGFVALKNPWSIVRLSLRPAENEISPRTVMVSLSEYSRDRRQAFVKVIVTVEGNDPAALPTAVASDDAEPRSVKTVISVRADGGAGDISEYEFMLADARDKVAAGKEQEMTPVQHLMMRSFLGDTGYYLYHGTNHFVGGRFVQALLMLRNVYKDMVSRYQKMDDAARESYREVCFMIGTCYSVFKRWDSAYYYLSQVVNFGRFNHDRQYLNMMVNSGDPRAMDIVESAISDFKKYFEEHTDDVDLTIAEMHDFLRRSRVYLLIEQGRLEEAEAELQTMVGEDENRSFAIDELALISRLRGEK